MLRTLSSTDVLTALANRHRFMERLAAESGRAQYLQRPFSLVLLDVDHFKRVNDTYGHQVGDEVLGIAVASVVERLPQQNVQLDS